MCFSDLHNNGGRNVRSDAKHNDRKIGKASSRKDVKEPEKLVVREKTLKFQDINAGDRNGREETEGHEHHRDEQESLAQRGIIPNQL